MVSSSITKPVWFCDVDGVLITEQSYRHSHINWRTATTTIENSHLGIDGTYSITWEPELITFINEMSKHVEFVWLTSWGHTADIYLPPLTGLKGDWMDGFSYLALIPHRYDYETSVWEKKQEAVFSLISPADAHNNGRYHGRPIIWTDDEITTEAAERVSKLASEENSLVIKTNPERGLDADDRAVIRAFILRQQ